MKTILALLYLMEPQPPKEEPLGEKEETAPEGIINSIIRFIKGIFIKDSDDSIKPEKSCPETKGFFLKRDLLLGDVELLSLSLPYTLKEIIELDEKKQNKINSFIENTVSDNASKYVMIPPAVRGVQCFSEFLSKSPGEKLKKALIPDLLDLIYKKRGVKLGEMEVVIISGGNYEDLSYVLKEMSTELRYVTVISNDPESIKDILDQVYEEAGLSIGVTASCETLIKRADIIINLGSLDGSAINARNNKALILNCGPLFSEGRSFIGNLVVNGIEIRLPEEIENKVSKEVRLLHDSCSLADAVISLMVLEDGGNMDLLQNMALYFRKEGYNIKGILGRHAKIKICDLPSYNK
ncbi:MAG TPA: hypothetical protein VF941_12250 [Clostridia bacterium]